ncbi:MAG TPA: hypothetical protein PLU67_01280 [Candidatus Kapabacteria bacterium]|jgi:hypothetical protein|nr:hypothetical protein [Candidatus Kapabacteria bacterium]
MFKKILAAIIAIVGALIAIRLIFFILSITYKIVSSFFFFGFSILLAIPLYLYIKNRLLNK